MVCGGSDRFVQSHGTEGLLQFTLVQASNVLLPRTTCRLPRILLRLLVDFDETREEITAMYIATELSQEHTPPDSSESNGVSRGFH
jgi:hypothetical protein